MRTKEDKFSYPDDPGFALMAYPLDKAEYEQLVASIVVDGARPPVWILQGCVVGGFAAYTVYRQYRIDFPIRAVSLAGRTLFLRNACIQELSRHLPYAMRKYLLGKLYGTYTAEEQSRMRRENGGPTRAVANRTIRRYAWQSRLVDRIWMDSEVPELALHILRGRVRLPGNGPSQLDTNDVAAFNAECRRLLPGCKSRGFLRQPIAGFAEATVTSIKEMPRYNPDSPLLSLSLTMRSWTESIQRTESVADFSQTSDEARSRLLRQIRNHQNTLMSLTNSLLEK